MRLCPSPIPNAVTNESKPAARAPLDLKHLPTAPEEEDHRRLRASLKDSPPALPARFLYDAHGSELFEKVTVQPEYYPTDAEREILSEHARDLVSRIRPKKMVELGSGYSIKTRLLIEAMDEFGGKRYVAWDVSESAIQDAAEHLSKDYPWLEITGVVGDFHREWPSFVDEGPCLVTFLGSTIGNFDPDSRHRLLTQLRAALRPQDGFLLGFDLVKPAERLRAAYNDAEGVTAAFTLNALRVANRELEGDFPLEAFDPQGVWCPDRSLVEMRLVAKRPVSGRFAEPDVELTFEPGDYLRTEVSTKFTLESLGAELAAAGLSVETHVTDPAGDFAMALARPV